MDYKVAGLNYQTGGTMHGKMKLRDFFFMLK